MADTTDSIYNISDFFDGDDDGVWNDGVWNYDDGQSDEERALEILGELEDNPNLMQEFNMLLRQKKLKQLRNNEN